MPGVVAFTTLPLIVTLVHADRFHFGAEHGAFTRAMTWLWLVVYAVVPSVMAVILFAQMRQPGNDPPRRAPMHGLLRGTLLVHAAVMLGLGVALLARPQAVADAVWPWALTPLTARAIAAWLVGLGAAAAQAAWERDLTRVRGAMAAYIAFALLQIVALPRFAAAGHPVTGGPVLDWRDARTWAYVGFVLSIAAAGTYGWLAAHRTEASAGPSASEGQ